jgi:hypothetical protein
MQTQLAPQVKNMGMVAAAFPQTLTRVFNLDVPIKGEKEDDVACQLP